MVETVAEVMTRTVATIAPDASVREAARRMDELNVGALVVCDHGRLVGILTDRDIAVRATAAGQAPDATRVASVMTEHVRCCREDEPVTAALDRMGRFQIRRLPVVNDDDHLIGIVALGDFAADRVHGADEALRRISEPAEPDLSGTPSQRRAEPAGVLGELPEGRLRPNDEVEQEIRDRFAGDGLGDAEIDVEVTDGVVTLVGTVDSFEARARAESEATQVQGVLTIVNHLRIRKDRSR